MIKIDENFLSEVGLADMPADEKAAFLAHAQEELEVRVGQKMSDGLTVDQLMEFDGIMNNDPEVMERVLNSLGDFREDKILQKLLKRAGLTEPTAEILGEFLSVKWIQQNRPDYREVAEGVFADLKHEILGGREQILATA